MQVELRATEKSGLVIVKRPRPDARDIVRMALVEQALQLRVLRTCCPKAPFPEVLAASREQLVLRYVPGVTLRDSHLVIDQRHRRRLLAAAAATVFDLASGYPDRDGPADLAEGDAPPGLGFLAAEMHRRVDRLLTATRELACGSELYDAMKFRDGGALLRSLQEASNRGTFERIDRDLAPLRLGLGIHGDLTPQNIIYSPEAQGERMIRGESDDSLCLIDPRGLVRWGAGRPWWDPVFDLAAVIVFDGAIDCLARAPHGRAQALALADTQVQNLAAAREEIVRLWAADPRASGWIAQDSNWSQRLDVAMLARLLGNVSVQAEHGGIGGAGRAAQVYAIAALWYRQTASADPGWHRY